MSLASNNLAKSQASATRLSALSTSSTYTITEAYPIGRLLESDEWGMTASMTLEATTMILGEAHGVIATFNTPSR